MKDQASGRPIVTPIAGVDLLKGGANAFLALLRLIATQVIVVGLIVISFTIFESQTLAISNQILTARG